VERTPWPTSSPSPASTRRTIPASRSPGRLHPSDSRRAGLRGRSAALHRSRRVHRLRCPCRGVPVRRLLRRGPAPRRVDEVHPDQLGVLQAGRRMIRANGPALGSEAQMGVRPHRPKRARVHTRAMTPRVEDTERSRSAQSLSSFAVALTAQDEAEGRASTDVVERCGLESFPASDPPSWWSGQQPAGEPRRPAP
jgi:hypothetical protein